MTASDPPALIGSTEVAVPKATNQLPAELKQLALAQAAASGHSSLDEYIQGPILADIAEPPTPELEAHLLAALETSSQEMTAADWEEKR